MEVQEVKNIVGTARDLLVGKVPLPVEQCQEITRALIYKFLSAEDALSVGLGGEPSYFTGERAECRWDALMSPEQTANEVDRRYRDGMAMLGRYDNMPAIQTIYKDAFIPYNDPIILRDFLRVIDRFDTGDTEKIGDAYEMLLQDLGAQASAGQFRTPRHIIDFIVAVINPQKHETILDPACGTGGFLASAWEYVNGGSRLSAADRGNLARNLVGYDISPTMEMLSTVNLFLHHKQQPVVSVYDTLTSEERWNDHYDVILANPPFMSPKGGIRPHGRFFSKSSRSEVLFVDYIMGHLNEGGRAGVIVPEGVIFQSQRAHTQLRRLLVGSAIGGLVAVVSLPGGVFQPYSGVKTSILILDKAVARRADGIAFFKVENDGYDLGAQRREIATNDLPMVQAELAEYLRRLRAGESLDDFAPQTGLVVAKERIAEGGEYNLSGERYRTITKNTSDYPMVKLGEPGLFTIVSGGTPKSDEREYWNGDIPWITLVDLPADDFITEISATERTITQAGLARSSAKIIPANSVVVSSRATIGRIGINRIPLATNQGFKNIVIDDASRAMVEYVALAVNKLVPEMEAQASGATYKEITKTKFANLEIPLPPLEVQREIVAEIEGYQRVIDGARAVVDNWRPRIAVDPEWPLVELGKLVDVLDKMRKPVTKSDRQTGPYPYYGATGVLDYVADYLFDEPLVLVGEDGAKWDSGEDTAFSITGKSWVNNHAHVLRPNRERLLDGYLVGCLVQTDLSQFVTGVTVPKLNQARLRVIPIPLPPLETQRAIVSEIEAERGLVSANRELAERMEGRIAEAVGRVWGR